MRGVLNEKIKVEVIHDQCIKSESGWARVPMSQTRPCVDCHEPDFGRLYIYIYPSLVPESRFPRRTRESDSYVYGHFSGIDMQLIDEEDTLLWQSRVIWEEKLKVKY
jgi:hypothetical protein